ncbi:DNA methylase [Belliella buryatensis]|uniref:DNA methylase n=1 Tax=Belliella buryatensis TaxID=1500549 RepID=A0A239H846_9BACT|nr:DNA methyltransferase [Belliella buryatensis]SNS76434.1 DNA methylase [Belliella buryatensis]
MISNTDKGNKVVVLGKEFNSEEERRSYFREELRKKLPELKQMEGFPIGEDEDIINLSDPPFYTACPNPWLNDFIAEWEEEKKEVEKKGLRKTDFEVSEPYTADVSEGKNNPIYNAHSYHTKVPHPAIMRYILHYTQPGDIVFDGFAGTGMTGVAASMCGNPSDDLKYKIERETSKVVWGKRNAICSDLSPIASVICSNYNIENNTSFFLDKSISIVEDLEEKYGWIYKVESFEGLPEGVINYLVWSDVMVCNNCLNEIIFFNEAVDKKNKKVKSSFSCSNCHLDLSKKNISQNFETVFDNLSNELKQVTKQVPVFVNYSSGKKRFERLVQKSDLDLIDNLQNLKPKYFFPKSILIDGFNTSQPKKSHGIKHLHDFYTRRNLFILSEFWERFKNDRNLVLLFTSISSSLSSRLVRYNLGNRGNGMLNGTLYISSLNAETNVFKLLKGKLRDISHALSLINSTQATSINSATDLNISSESIDYIFTDPPFGGNIMYSELNTLWESWLKVKTNSLKEAIENKFQKKSILDYQELMSKCFKEYFRILKKGKWMTVEFSNTSAAVWNGIQISIQNAGFVVANISSIDKKQGSFKAVTTVTAVKQDLVISCYKPSSKFDQRFNQNKHIDVGVWDFVSEHLDHLPVHITSGNSTTAIIERSPKILFDRLIAFYVQRGLPVPIDASKFQLGLRERFIERDGMFFTNEQVQEYDRKKSEVPNFIQMSIFVGNEQDAIYWLRNLLEKNPKTEQDLHPLWMKEVAGNMRKGDSLPEMRTILEENFLKNDKGQWYLPDPENEADLEQLRTKRLLKQFENYKSEAYKPKGKIKEARVESLRAGFKQCYQDKDFKTIVQVGDRIPNNLLMEDEVLLQFYDIASSRV